MTTAVLVIDMIKDFVTGEFENERAQKIVPNIKEIVEAALSSDKPIIYVCDTHPEDDNEFSIWGEHAVSGTEGAEIIPELEPEKNDYKIEKSKYSAFYDTKLESLLEELGVDKLVLTGVLTHICIQHTSADAFYRGYDIVLPIGGVEDVSDEKHGKSLEFIEENYGATIMEYKEIIKEW